MYKIYRMSLFYFFFSFASFLHAAPNNIELAVWVNEAITATYTYDYKNYLTEQSAIAKYFSALGWSNYSTALSSSGLPASVQKNQYFVNAVATWPPEIKLVGNNRWQALMPILVTYKNPQYQQKQALQVTIFFGTVPSGGVRGLAIDSLQTKIIQEPCKCVPADNANVSIDKT